MVFGRKRVYAGPMRQGRNKKFKRSFRRRRFTRGKKTSAWTSQSAGAGGIAFKRHRFKRKVLNRLLYNSSAVSTHYRSNSSISTTVASPALSIGTMTVLLNSTRRFGGLNFFVAAGGAINPDGGAMPTFATNSDITVRGGMYGIRVSNAPDLADTDKDALSCVLYLIRTPKGASFTNLPATVPLGWDPSLIQDFQTNVGKVVMRKNFMLQEGECMTIEKRMFIQKIDQTEYASNISEYMWLVLIGNTSTTSSHNAVVTTYFNLSFVGDTV